MTVPASIAQATQKTQEWLKSLADSGDLDDEAMALKVLRVVLHHLRDRLTPTEAIDLGSQLPTIIRGIYYEGWCPSRTPDKTRSKHEFVEAVSAKLHTCLIEPEAAVRDVFSLIAHHCDPGEISDVIDQMPADIKRLWPASAQTFRARTRL